MNVSIRMVGFVQAMTRIQGVGQSGAQLNGPIATAVSRLPYARFIETGRSSRQVRRAGPAEMFKRGIADAAVYARTVLPEAIAKGPTYIGPSKRKIRDRMLERIRAYTPVRTGALRASVSVAERPRIQ